MLDSYGFDLWANEYDKSVEISDENNEYPFAGYKALMNSIYGVVMQRCPAKILDIGFGTALLSEQLYNKGNTITGIDFSDEMVKIAKEKMPKARLIRHDFSLGIPQSLLFEKFDFIVTTYAIHHLTDNAKIDFIMALLVMLEKDGRIIIGDVSFQTRDDLDKCKNSCGDAWDNDEFYFVFEEIYDRLNAYCDMKYHKFSDCSGVLEICSKPDKLGFE
ncbi:hypothetical protein FACS1894217_05810 [Clostridia bacterium]|nr:hypothetical protein FACS1894217_05810 [Clostridia bacterium]